MKKILSLTLAVLMLVSVVPTAYALAGDPCEICGQNDGYTECSDCGAYVCNSCFVLINEDEVDEGAEEEYLCLDCYEATEPEIGGNWGNGTTVTYTATGTEEWTVTVPATLAPGAAGDVTAAGTWGSNRKLVVTADDDVTLTNSINAADQKVLTVTFADIALVGDNTQSVSETKQVSVAAMPSDALFGTWSGTFYYDVELVDVQ